MKISWIIAEPLMTLLPYLSILKLSGVDTSSFLQAQLAADVSSLGDGDSCFAAYCSPRGQVIALLLVCRQGSTWFLVVEASLASLVAKRLQMYVLRAKVVIEEQPEFHVAGLFADDNNTSQATVFTPRGMTLRYVLSATTSADNAQLLHWRQEEIRHGVCWLQNETSERFLPQMLGLDGIGAISFTKGCYPGQEIIARTRYLGKLKRRPVLLEVDGKLSSKPGTSCVLTSAGDSIEAVVIEAASPDGNITSLLLVAPLEPTAEVHAMEIEGDFFSVRRMERASD